MADGPSLETYVNHANSAASAESAQRATPERAAGEATTRSLSFIGVAIVAAGLVYALVRAILARPPADPTTERIQQLIDEANRLLKQLDEKKPE